MYRLISKRRKKGLRRVLTVCFLIEIENTTAIDALKTGLQDLLDLVSHVRDAYAEDLAKQEYEVFEEIA